MWFKDLSLLGFDLVEENDTYLTFKNNGSVKLSSFNVHPETPGKVVVKLNYDLYEKYKEVSCAVLNDGGTRNCYYGNLPDIEFLKTLLENIR